VIEPIFAISKIIRDTTNRWAPRLTIPHFLGRALMNSYQSITMELFIFIWLLFTSLASGAVIERRQAGGGLGSIITQLKGSKMSPAKIIDVPPRVRQDAIRQQVRYGPFNIPSQKVSINIYRQTG
jgi:hypothetical protein